MPVRFVNLTSRLCEQYILDGYRDRKHGKGLLRARKRSSERIATALRKIILAMSGVSLDRDGIEWA
jgi:hypothetical protein